VNSKKIISTIFSVVVILFVSKGLGFSRDIFLAYRFGAGMQADSFAMASNITIIIFISFGSGIIASIIPVLSSYSDKKELFKKFRAISLILFFASAALCALGMVFAKEYVSLIAKGFDVEKIEMTTKLVKILFPAGIIISLIYAFRALLQMFGKFKLDASISIPYNILVIGYLVLFAPKYGIVGLAVVTTLGWLMQMLIQMPTLIKRGYNPFSKIKFKDEDVKRFLILIVPTVITAMVYNVNTIVDKHLASTLSGGSVATLDYGFKLYTAVAATIILGIGTVLLPKFAKISDDLETFKKGFVKSIGGVMYVIVPISMMIIVYAKPLVTLFYKRGAFEDNAVLMTTITLSFYTIGMIGYAIQDICNRSFFALKNTKTPMAFGMLSVAVNIGLNFALVEKYGIKGLAFATSFAVILNALLLSIALSRKVNKIKFKQTIIKFIKITFVAVVIGYMSKNIYELIPINIIFIKLLISSIITMLMYYLVTYAIKIEEAIYIKDTYARGDKNE